MLYETCLNEMFSLRRFGIKLGLSTIRGLLEPLANPQNRFRSIHIAGSNGKGSIAAFLSAILQASGYRVGVYTSPHLVRFNERICVNGLQVADTEVVAAYEAVSRAHRGDRRPTFFELTTAMAFYEFARRQVDWAIIEAGMGGRLDATNVLSPELAVVSNVSLEHQMYLGRTLGEIAREKGGIIKTGTPLVTGVTQKTAVAVLEALAAARSAPLLRLGHDFRIRRSRANRLDYAGIDNIWRDLEISLQGDYQKNNAAIALAACEMLNRKSAGISGDAIRKGLLSAVWPGRLEVVSRKPFIILDGAHNRAAARELAKYLRNNLNDRPITLVVGILNDKPYRAMLKSLLPACRRVIVTRPKIERGLPPDKLSAVAGEMIDDVTAMPDVASAIALAVRTTPADAAICIAGSLYVVGEAKQAFAARDLLPGVV